MKIATIFPPQPDNRFKYLTLTFEYLKQFMTK